MERFSGRVALVTGVSSGIGEQVARLLVKEGLVVVGVARRQQRLTELAAALADGRGTLHPLVADVSREDEVRRVYQWIDDNLGGVTVVVNNAAVLSLQPVQDMDVATMMQLINTNVAGVMLSCREALLSMKKHHIKDGHIVNINSLAGHEVLNVAPYSMSAYAATKHAVTALCRGLRFDAHQMTGHKIRVTSISPGNVSTEMTPKGVVESLQDPEGILKPADVANAVLYALSCPQCVEISELTIHPTGDNI